MLDTLLRKEKDSTHKILICTSTHFPQYTCAQKREAIIYKKSFLLVKKPNHFSMQPQARTLPALERNMPPSL